MTTGPVRARPAAAEGGAADDAGPGDDPVDGGSQRRAAARRQALGLALTCALLAALVVAVCTRRLLAGLDPAGNPVAGLVFAVLLTGSVLLARRFEPAPHWTWLARPEPDGPPPAGPDGEPRTPSAAGTAPAADIRRRLPVEVGLGLAAAAVLCLGPLTRHLLDPGGALELHRFWVWGAVVTTVALSEEAFLRGALWQAVAAWRGDLVALALTTVAFALLHVPFYGWGIIPLDLAVGLLLGGLRMVGGGIAAPATAHLVADIAGWWLR